MNAKRQGAPSNGLKRREYEEQLGRLHVELVKLQE